MNTPILARATVTVGDVQHSLALIKKNLNPTEYVYVWFELGINSMYSTDIGGASFDAACKAGFEAWRGNDFSITEDNIRG